MALSRAAAAAARKAAKSRGLKGNRAEDGSMLSETPYMATRETHLLMEEEIPLLDDAGLNRAWLDTKQEIRELREFEGPESTAVAKAQDRLELIEEEMEERGGIGEWYEDEETAALPRE